MRIKSIPTLVTIITISLFAPLFVRAGTPNQESPQKKRRVAIHQRQRALTPPPQNSHQETPLTENPSLNEEEQNFLAMLFGELNGTQNFLSSIAKIKNPDGKKDALLGFFMQKTLTDLSLKKFVQILEIITTLPPRHIRELFYSIEEEYGERFLYDFVATFTIKSHYLTTKGNRKKILKIAQKNCCPVKNETMTMIVHREHLIKSFLKGFSTAPQQVLDEKEHKQYFNFIFTLSKQEQAKLLKKLLKHIGQYIKDLNTNDIRVSYMQNNPIESQHYSLEALYPCLKKIFSTNPELIEEWTTEEWLKNFLTNIASFYSTANINRLVDILGPEFPFSPLEYPKFDREQKKFATKIRKKATSFPRLFKKIERNFTSKKAQQKKIFTALKKTNCFSDLDIYLHNEN